MRSVWRGTTRAEKTTDSTRRFPGGVLSISSDAGLPSRDRVLILTCVVVITALAWGYLIHLDRQMAASMEQDKEMAAMGKGNWSVGLVSDERASVEQREAITAIASGAAGGPMAALSGLIGTFLGVQPASITFNRSGSTWSVSAPRLVDLAAAGAMGVNPAATEPLHLDHSGHPAADRIALAHASKSHVHALGLDWDDVSGTNNGQYAPFSWRSA